MAGLSSTYIQVDFWIQKYQSQLQQILVDLSLSNTFSIVKLDSISIKAFKFFVASHYSKTFLHFSKGFAIFCEGDQESANNGKDDEIIVWQKSNLPLLLSLALAISTQAALDASAPYDTLAATGHNMAFGPAFGHSKLIKLIGRIGLGVSFIGLGVSFIRLGISVIGSFVCCVDLSLCRKPPRYVPYKYTYVPYNGTFDTSDQGQMLDV